jgi:single-stranded DNA-binding protein
MFRVAVSGRRDQEPSFFTVIVGRLQQRSWTAEDGSARSTVEVLAEELGPSLRWATATSTRATSTASE